MRAQVVLDDRNGDKITPIVHAGFPPRMPSFSSLSDSDIQAIAAFLHNQPLGNRGAPTNLDILVGNAAAGKAYFYGAGKCNTCHSVTGDLAGIGAKFSPKDLQNRIVSGGGGGGFGRPAGPPPPPTTVTVTLPSGQTVNGDLDHIDAFLVTLTEKDGTHRSFSLDGAQAPKVTLHNPLQAHIDMLPHWKDSDIHNLTAYLATLK